MKQYIDKSALLAEIERRIASLESIGSENYLHDNYPEQYAMLMTLKSFKISINTLEVKEVDLESNSFDATVCKIGNTYLKEMDKDAIVKALESYKDGDKVKVIIIKEE